MLVFFYDGVFLGASRRWRSWTLKISVTVLGVVDGAPGVLRVMGGAPGGEIEL